MSRLLLRRLTQGILLLFGVSILSFVLLEAAPGEYLTEMKLDPQISPETLAALRAQYGMDRPLPVRYVRWVSSVARGEFGFSFAYNLPASELLLARAKNTLLLTIVASVLSWIIAIPLGIWSAGHRRHWLERFISGGTSFMLAIPEVTLALAMLVIALRTRAFPVGGMTSPRFDDFGLLAKITDIAWHLVLPVAAIALGALPMLLRHVRSSMIEVLDSPFMLAARGHGLPRRVLLYRYGLRAAANPLLSLLGTSIATLLSASLLVEIIVGWPGLGPLLLEAITARDLYVVVGAVFFSTVMLLTGNLIADILLCAVDPRIRTEAT
ncbi:MAG: ABC transporter permease [Terriglobales bacterium]